MDKTKDLLDRIDEVRANSVTPEKFKETWGYSLQEHVEDMMDFINELEGKKTLKVAVAPAAERRIRKVAIAAAERLATENIAAVKPVTTKRKTAGIVWHAAEAPDKEMIGKLAKKIAELLEHVKKGSGAGKAVTQGTLIQAAQKQWKRDTWTLKLVAVETGGGKSYQAGEPVIITSVDSPRAPQIVAQVCGAGKKARIGKIETKIAQLKGIEAALHSDGVKGLMVDVGDLVGVLPTVTGGPKGRRGPKGARPKE